MAILGTIFIALWKYATKLNGVICLCIYGSPLSELYWYILIEIDCVCNHV